MSYRTWLAVCIVLILSMVSIGGFTRLTESGLSITEWKPVTGVIPPLSKSAWQKEFDKYKNTPEYKVRHFSISYAEFQFIYLVEYFHRLVGRVLGLVFVAGLVYFFVVGNLSRGSQLRLCIALILGLVQGFVGWYMVKSGLLDVPAVSHYRLALHLFCASLLFVVLVYEFLLPTVVKGAIFEWNLVGYSLMFLLSMQIVLGGLVAGLKAGLVCNTFPLMNGEFFPAEIFNEVSLTWFDDPVFVQFLHRMNGFLLTLVCLIYLIISFFYDRTFRARVFLMALMVLLQMFFGVLTLLFHVPIDIALLHQIMAFILLGICVSFLRVQHE
ncbi:COX15/CtaA family protein [Neorickettsia findlayensis]|uniref:Heme A synthase n=1 Tax=Neorickettsia findlayensis TaxID=2686014 RepID=A0A6P1GAV5_9RICK|nr:COX15/CtaA family protein [Neorickettsia findlayensis]QHD65458.1 heme A synthase [Neorickettsia findlayensis]